MVNACDYYSKLYGEIRYGNSACVKAEFCFDLIRDMGKLYSWFILSYTRRVERVSRRELR